jgi:hypothetical protein
MELRMDADLQSVAEFMQANLPAAKLVSVADSLSTVARLLWSHLPQEPCLPACLSVPKTSLCSQSQSASTE